MRFEERTLKASNEIEAIKAAVLAAIDAGITSGPAIAKLVQAAESDIRFERYRYALDSLQRAGAIVRQQTPSGIRYVNQKG